MPAKVKAASENGDPADKRLIGYTEPPDLSESSRKLVKMMNWCQSEDVSISKAVKEMRKLFDSIEEDYREKKNFFQNLVFMLQIPLVNGSSKERPNTFDEKIFEVVCRFSASFVLEAIQTGKENDQHSDLEIPWVMKKLFVWLLDRHEVYR
jgi:hypothetical protein